MRLAKLILISLILVSCANRSRGDPSRSPNDARLSESPPCDECRSGEAPNFDVKVNRAYREQANEILALDSGALIGVLPALNVIANSPENCNYCHSFSESAVEFDFAAKEDSILAARFPNSERVLLFPGSQVPERDSAEFWNAFANLREIPLNENKELKNFLKKLSLRYKVRYLAFASFIEVTVKDKKTFDWESEWSLWDAQKGELLFWDYQNLTAKSKNSAPVDRGWAGVFR
jgi:hypothetical protein